MSDTAGLIAEMARAAADFLAALSPSQRKRASLPFADEGERRTWYYFPRMRGGLPLGQMASRLQQQLALRLVRSGLSEAGFNAASTIIGLDNLLDSREGFLQRPYPYGAPDSRFRDPLMYFVTVFGSPFDDGAWGWRFEGHHVCVNYTIRAGAVSATPLFFGADPADSPLPGGKVLRPLGGEEDAARALLSLLRPEQLAQAIISPAVPLDIVQSNRPRVEDGALPLPLNMFRGQTPDTSTWDRRRALYGLTPALEESLRFTAKPKGLAGGAMDETQRAALSRLLHVYTDRLPEPLAAQQAKLVTPAGASFAWAGAVEPGGFHYYRVQAERLLIEYDNAALGGNDIPNHIHAVLRDPVGDFGDVLARHYAAAH